MRPSSLLGRSDKGSAVSPGPAVEPHHDQPHPEWDALARLLCVETALVGSPCQRHTDQAAAYVQRPEWAEVRAAILAPVLALADETDPVSRRPVEFVSVRAIRRAAGVVPDRRPSGAPDEGAE